MENPIPVDTNKLKSILANAKKVMHKVEENSPVKQTRRQTESYTPNVDTPIYDERDERDFDIPSNYSPSNQPLKNYTREQVMASNLPPAIKEAMINKPIPQLSHPPSKFSLEGLEDLIDEKPSKLIKEQRNNGLISITENDLYKLVDERVNKILADMFVKTITEQTIKKTLNALISEGKLTVKKKI